MTNSVKQSGVLRLQNAVTSLEQKLNKARIISSADQLSNEATRIDTEILKALKSENSTLKKQNAKAKKELDSLIKSLKAKL